MRIVCLAVVSCAGMFCACDIDQSAFERNIEAGVSSKDKGKEENGGADLIRPDKPARPDASAQSAAAPPAADGGMPEPTPDAADPRDAAPAAPPGASPAAPAAPAAAGMAP